MDTGKESQPIELPIPVVAPEEAPVEAPAAPLPEKVPAP
jgi:hypothetical protein